jgi:hypothetical protein
MSFPQHVVGADRLFHRFGAWPTFRDAEVVRVRLEREGGTGPSAEITIHAWTMRSDVDDRGYYRTEHYTLVRFVLEGIED